MRVALLLCILSLALSGAASNFKHQLMEPVQNNDVKERADTARSEREKRGAALLLKDTSWETHAANILGPSAQRRSKLRRRRLRTSAQLQEVWTADVGHRTIRLKTYAKKGNPVIEVTDENAKEVVKFGYPDQ